MNEKLTIIFAGPAQSLRYPTIAGTSRIMFGHARGSFISPPNTTITTAAVVVRSNTAA